MLRGSWTHPIGGAPRTARRAARPSRAPRGPRALRLADDAAHTEQFRSHPHKEWYTEWWYFNVRDPKTGITLFAMYDVAPFALGLGVFGAMVFPNGAAPFDVSDVYPPSEVGASGERPDVRIGEKNGLEAIDDDTYRIRGASRDGRVSFDLTLERVPGAPPSWLLDDAQGPLDWEVAFWMTWLPLARARGTVTIDGVAHVIEDAAAYHDHNWGVWCSPIRNWQWLQCSSPAERVALDLGYSDGFDPPRAARLDLDGRTIHFDASGIDLPTYSGFRDWPSTPWKYPERAKVSLVDPDGRVRVEVEWSAPEGETLPLWAAVVLFEQHVRVGLRVFERSGDGGWELARSLELDGIAEWSDSYLAEWSTGEGLVGAYAAEATVFGAGIAGLTAAHELADRGFAVTVVEPEEALDPRGVRAMAVGGMARSQYARVPSKGPAPASFPAGRPTPDARDDRWSNRRVVFADGSSELPAGAQAIVAEAAREFHDRFCEQGYRLRVTGSASVLEAEPRALGARRAEAVRDRLIEIGVAPELVVLAEDAGVNRPEAVIALENWVLPGEHGYRFFPRYYRHLHDTLSRIPVYDRDGRQTHRRVLDNLRPTPEMLMLKSGRRPAEVPTPGVSMSALQTLRLALSSLVDDDYDPRDFLQLGLRVARYLATCPDRRGPLEDMSWWSYLCGFSPKTRCYLYRYSNAFTRESTACGRVLAAFDWRYGDARTNGSTWMQLFEPLPDDPARFDGTLDAPTTEAWFAHWRRYLEDRGVRFVAGSLERLELAKVDGADVVVPWVKRQNRPVEPWVPRTRRPHYVVVATDAPTAEAVSAPLPKVGVPEGLVGYTTRYHGRERDPRAEPGLGPDDRLQTLSGVQYFFDQDFGIGSGHAYSLDAPWSLSTLTMQRAWSKVPFVKHDGFAGLLSVDIGDFKVPAGPTKTTAWDSTKERLGEQVWMQLTNDLRTAPLGPDPLRLPRPTWFHVDDNLRFGDRDGLKGVIVRNETPYLVPITSDWKRRPGTEPFDPNVPRATSSRTSPSWPGVWLAPHGGYPVHWGSLVYAGIYLKTFTRMTTMESANESARHAVNAILDHYDAHHGATVAPPDPERPTSPDPSSIEADEVPPQYIGDYCGIWNIERYENPSFDTLKAIDKVLWDRGLPHLFDLLGVEVLPSVLSHLIPYRGDCSPVGEAPPPPVPEPAPWCPPFVGDLVGKVARRLRRRR